MVGSNLKKVKVKNSVYNKEGRYNLVNNGISLV